MEIQHTTVSCHAYCVGIFVIRHHVEPENSMKYAETQDYPATINNKNVLLMLKADPLMLPVHTNSLHVPQIS